MKKCLFFGVALVVLGLLTIFAPQCLKYLNLSYVDLFIFLEDHPAYNLSIGLVLVFAGIALIIFSFVWRRNVTGVIQKSSNFGVGQHFLKYSAFSASQVKTIIEISDDINPDTATTNSLQENLGVLRSKSKEISTSRIRYLGISLVPFIVKLGSLIGNTALKIDYFIFDRESKKIKHLKGIGHIQNSFVTKKLQPSKKQSKELLVVVESSFKMGSITPNGLFKNMDRISLSAEHIATDNVCNRKTLDHMADQITQVLMNEGSKYTKIHLLLNANAPLCFAVGLRISTHNFPSILVYQYSETNPANNRPWAIMINSSQNEVVFSAKK